MVPLTRRGDLLREYFTLLSTDEPRLERFVLKKIDNDDVEEHDWALLRQAAYDIVRHLLDPLLDADSFLFELVQNLVESDSIHLLLHLLDGQSD